MAFARRLWPVIENMTQMAAAATAMHFGPNLKDEFAVFFRPDGIWQAFEETWPAGSTVILCIVTVNGQNATPAVICADACLFVQWAGVRTLGPFLAQDEVFVLAQSCPPFCVAATNLKAACRSLKWLGNQGRACRE